MADSEELKLRIVPEIDTTALKKIQTELDRLKSEITVQTKAVSGGGTNGGGGRPTSQDVKSDTAAVNDNTAAKKANTQATNENNQTQQQADKTLKEHLKTIRAEIDLQDLKLRTIKETASSAIKDYRDMASAGVISNQQMMQMTSQSLDIVKQAENETRQEYARTRQALQDLTNEYGDGNQAIINRQKQLQTASDKVNQSNRTIREATELLRHNTSATLQNAQASNTYANATNNADDALKNELKTIRARIDAQDLQVRTVRANAEREIESLQQRAAANQITTDQMNQGIIAQQTLVENAETQARQEYAATALALENLSNQYGENTQTIINRQKQLFYANERLESGFNSMSGSMQKVVSNTKSANLAFMNFGRIVQDAPFGLIGISNNIDPLLNSFNDLKTEVGGAGAALKAMGRQLLGPAGIIFLLGSALPTALLFLQKMQKDATKEADALAEALKRVADEFGRLSAQAASKRGIAQVNDELKVTTQNLELVSKELAIIERQIDDQVRAEIARIAAINAQGNQRLANSSEIRKRIEDQNKEVLFSLRLAKQSLEASKENLNTEQQNIEAQRVINGLKKQGNAESLTLNEILKERKDLLDLEMRALEIVDPITAQIRQEQERINGILSQMILDAELMATESGKKLYNDLRQRLSTIADEIKNGQDKAEKAIKESDDRIYKTREELLASFKKYVQSAVLNTLEQEQIVMRQLIESEFTTDEERLRIYQQFQENKISILEEFAKKQTRIQNAQDLNTLKEQEKALDELLKSEILSDDDKLVLLRNFQLNKTKILNDYVNQQKQIQIKADQELAESQKRLRLDFAKQQQDILSFRDERSAGRNEAYLIYLNNTNQQALAIEQEGQMQLRDLRKRYYDLGLLDTEEYKLAEKSIRESISREVANVEMEQFGLVANAAIAGFESIFGQSKLLNSAQVVVDTIMGMQKAIAMNPPPSPFGIIAAAGIAAKGATAIRKINSTQKGSTQIDGGGGGTMVMRESFYDGFAAVRNERRPPMAMADMTASSLSDRLIDRETAINVDARVDRRGLAIAVREGEREIRTVETKYM